MILIWENEESDGHGERVCLSVLKKWSIHDEKYSTGARKSSNI